jgi:hypothetical protein
MLLGHLSEQTENFVSFVNGVIDTKTKPSTAQCCRRRKRYVETTDDGDVSLAWLGKHRQASQISLSSLEKARRD